MTALLPPETIRNHRKALNDAANQALRPPPQMSVPEWADEYRRLSTAVGAIGGKWRTSRVEVARGPMMAVTERGVRNISAMTCTQLLKTSLLENIIGRAAHLDPGPILLTQPKDDSVKAFSKERIAKMARATSVLTPLLGDERTRRGEDTVKYKEFPGGFLAMESAGSPSNLAMRPIRITLADEVDKYVPTKEGDPLTLLEERTSTYDGLGISLHVRACSPTSVETSRIFKAYGESDQRRPFVACPHCGYEQALDFFKHVQWEKSEDRTEHYPMTAAIYCQNCGVAWSEAERLAIMTTRGAVRWRQTKKFKCCGIEQEPLKTRKWKWDAKNEVGRAVCTECHNLAVSNHHAGFGHVSKLYSPFTTVVEMAQKWLVAKDDPETKQAYVNTQLGEPFESEAIKRVDENALAARREIYAAAVPAGGAVLTCGVDVQSGSELSLGRIEAEVVAWGRGEESWSVDYKVFSGNPAEPEVWDELDRYLLSKFKHESGNEMMIRGVCIDSGGHNTEDVYKFARARLGRNVWAIKGASERSSVWSPVWPIPKLIPQKTRVTGYKPVLIGVNAAKESIRQKLLTPNPGPGYMHFPVSYDPARFDQLTSEDLVIERKQGVRVRRWLKKAGRANEALDCRVYAYAALCGLRAVRKLNLDKTAEVVNGPRSDVQAVPATKNAPRETLSKEVKALPYLEPKEVTRRNEEDDATTKQQRETEGFTTQLSRDRTRRSQFVS